MTQDVNLLSTHAAELAEQIVEHLQSTLHIAARVRDVGGGRGYRVYQVAKPKNRHLVDIRAVKSLPPTNRVSGVLVVTPAELIAGKVIAFQSRRDKPKSGTDWRDIAVLLLAFPELKNTTGDVRDRLLASEANEATIAAWEQIVSHEIEAGDEDDEF